MRAGQTRILVFSTLFPSLGCLRGFISTLEKQPLRE